MLAALHTHPLAILREHVCPNLFYQAPLILDSRTHGRCNGHGNGNGNGNGHDISLPAKVEWMLTQLHHARIAEKTRRRLAERIESDSQWLAAIVESAEDAIISKDLNGIITSWNNSAKRIFGYTADEAIGRPVTLLIPSDRLDEEGGILARIRQGERIEHYKTL